MLARTLRPRAGREAVRTSSQNPVVEPSILPWLCPARIRWTTRIAPIKATSPRITRLHAQRPPQALAPRDATRSLATTTTADISPSQSSPPPFQGIARAFAPHRPDPQLAQLMPWDTSNPLILPDMISSATQPSTPKKFGIGGDPVELHQNLYACLQVGRLERAEAILQRLVELYDPAAPELIDAHNIYLQTKFELAEQNQSEGAFQEVGAWYEANMLRRGIEPSAQTLVTLLRAALALPDKAKREEKARSYLAVAQQYGPEILEDINSSPDFEDHEWEALIRLQDAAFEDPPPIATAPETYFSTPGGIALAIQQGLIPDPSLAIDAVELKGAGLSSLKSSLSVFEPGKGVPYPEDMEGSEEDKEKAYAYMRQLRLERDGLEAATERWRLEDEKLREMGIHGVLQSKPMQALLWNWYSAALPKVEEEIKQVKEVLSKPESDNMTDDRHSYGPYMERMSAKDLAATVLTAIIQSTASYTDKDHDGSMKITAVAQKIGADVERLIHEDAKKRHAAYLRTMRQRARRDLVAKLRKDTAAPQPQNTQTGPRIDADLDTLTKADIPQAVKVKLGAVLLDIVLQTAKISMSVENPKTGQQVTSTFPAFNYSSTYMQGKRVAHLAPHPEILNKLKTEKVGIVQPLRLPMLVEPKPWLGYSEGAYYTLREPVIRLRDSDYQQKAYAVSAIKNNDMKQVLAALDALGKVPWKINRDVFNVMAAAWNAGEDLGGLIPKDSGLRPPEELPIDASSDQRAKYRWAMKRYENTKRALHSRKAFQNFQLEVARSYVNEPRFFYPHSIDFRGRAYPVPPLLNHIGSDISRGLLLFANGKELGNTGLQWLKIHLANLYGYDKASLRDREKFTDDNLADIYDSANNPLGGNRWWAKADDPWQCLACCIELRNALDSPDPTKYVAYLPIHQDGTCNGLQHYAALGGDRAGASQVNLEPSDKPQDIYTGVAEIVKEMVAEDAKKGNKNAQFMDGKVTRNVVKRTVMTNVYGVTFQGASKQVLGELTDMFPQHASPDSEISLQSVAVDIARKIFAALGRIFNGAQEIQCWLGECGDRITSSLSAEQIQKIKASYEGRELGYDAKYNQSRQLSKIVKKNLAKDISNFKNSIIWTTPLKLPVVQPYRKSRSNRVKTALTVMSIGGVSRSDEVDKRKQLQAFPPNFIHSLDATHMLLSALKCSELGIQFAAVHDSFWTHAADIPTMNVILRDAFVRMHSEDIIGRLLAEFKARYAGSMYLATLYHDADVAGEIAAWRKKNRRGGSLEAQIEEVALEAQRQELLNSDDPEKVQKGKEMVTPTSIWLKYADPTSVYSKRTPLLGDTARGATTKSKKAMNKLKEGEAKELSETLEAQDEAASPLDAEEFEDDVLDEAEEALEDEELEESGSKKKKPGPKLLKVWLPLMFPPVPKKGDWDVQRLRQSKYFFS